MTIDHACMRYPESEGHNDNHMLGNLNWGAFDDLIMHPTHPVLCSLLAFLLGPSSCSDGEVQLVGGENELEGRVEICYNGV